MARTYAVQDEVDRQVSPLLEEFDVQLANQQALVDGYRFVSPAVVAHGALTELAGTGMSRYRAWRDQVDGFHAAWQEFFLPRIFRGELLTAADYSAIPRFRFEEPGEGLVAGRVGLAVVAVGASALVLLLLAGWRLRRMEVAG
jgi:ABC-2 type transport system permease protein